MIKEAIGRVVLREDLNAREMEEVMSEIVLRKASAAQIGSFLVALRMKKETPEEMAAAARVLKDQSLKMNFGRDSVCLDREEITAERETILGTVKGFSKGTTIFNVSTATAFVVAGGGEKVVKYVRRSYPTLCGCADVMEALGINLDLTSTQLERCFREIGICFLYEPMIQNELEHTGSIRRSIGIRTIFNLLDPLINPAGAKAQVLGVYEPDLTDTMAIVLKHLGIEKGIVVHGEDTLDEISITGKTKVSEFKGDEMKSRFIEPEDFGFKRRKLIEIGGGTKEENSRIILEILNGAKGGKRDITVLNAAAAFMVAGKAKDFKEGIEMAQHSIDSGRALRALENLVGFTCAEHRFLRNAYPGELANYY